MQLDSEIDEWVRNDLGLPDNVTLCLGDTALGTLNADKRKPELRKTFLARLYTIVVDQWDKSLPQPALQILSNDGRPFVAVVFGAIVALQAKSIPAGLSLYFRSSWQAPHWPMRMEVVGWDLPGVSLPQLKELMAGAEAFQQYVHRGRGEGTGNYPPGEEQAFLEDLERVLTAHERDGVRIVNNDMLANKMPMGRTKLFEMYRQVPEARDRFRRHKRGSSKR